MPEIVKPGTRPQRYLRIGLVGEPKTGKTRFATSLPWGEYWGEQALYVATDEGAADLDTSSILVANRERMIPVVPSTTVRKNKDGSESITYDPHTEAFAIASRNWRKEFPEVKTLIWDTMSQSSKDILRGYANSGVFSGEKGDKHVSIGTPGAPDYLANPMPGDYSLAQQATDSLIRFLFKQQMHVIVLFHIKAVETEGGVVLAFGPSVAGQASVRDTAALFDNLLRTDSVERLTNDKPPKKTTHYILHTQRKGLYLGGIRTGHDKNPIPELSLDNPREAWETLTKVIKGEK